MLNFRFSVISNRSRYRVPGIGHLQWGIQAQDSFYRYLYWRRTLDGITPVWKADLKRTLVLSNFFSGWWDLACIETRKKNPSLWDEMLNWKRPLNACYKDHAANEEVGNMIQNDTGVHDDLHAKTRMVWHVLKHSGKAKAILHATVTGCRRKDANITPRNGRVWNLGNPCGQRNIQKRGNVLLYASVVLRRRMTWGKFKTDSVYCWWHTLR